MKLLALDTSSAQCSVALWRDGALTFRAVDTAREHARLLLPMIDDLLAEAGTSLRQLDGIAFGRGPGSFTGVRIAAAVTQGLAAGAGLPVLPVSSLRALAAQARRGISTPTGELPQDALWLACMDARMGEVYWGLFAGDALSGEESVSPPGMLQPPGNARVAAAAGKGLAAFPEIAVVLQLPPQRVLDAAEPHARDIATLAARDLADGASWLDAALAQPVYLRNQVVHTANSRVQGAL